MSIDLKTLIKNQVHFGHQTSRWNPKMAPYIWGQKNNIHLIDVAKTAYLLDQAAQFLESVAAEGKSILWVGTKKAAQESISHVAQELHQPYVVHRWVGGTFTNNRQVRKSIANLLHYEDIVKKSEQSHYSKKELNLYQKRIDRLEKNVGGIRMLAWPIGAVVVVDVKKEHVVVKEALTMGIPIVAIVDTNSDPSNITFPIPANDDAPRSINVILEYLEQAVKRGQEVAATRPEAGLSHEELIRSAFEEPGMQEGEEEEEGEKHRRTQGRGAKKGAPVRSRGGRRPAPRESEFAHAKGRGHASKSADVAHSDATIQTPAIETKAEPVAAQEPTIQMAQLETRPHETEATETTIQTPALETKKAKK